MVGILKNKKGVTLVELLAVIVILGIIAAIAIPTIGGLIERQRENAANASHDNVMEAARLYYTERSGTMQPGAEFTLADLKTAELINVTYNVDDDKVIFILDGTEVKLKDATQFLQIDGKTVNGVAPE